TAATVYSADALSRFAPLSPPNTVTITHNTSLVLAYAIAYWVAVSASDGGVLQLPVDDHEYYASGTPLGLSASPTSGHFFVGWSGNGSGSYTGTDLSPSIRVNGPITEVATFAPVGAPAAPVVVNSIWLAPTTWLLMAAVGAGAGILLGAVLARRG